MIFYHLSTNDFTELIYGVPVKKILNCEGVCIDSNSSIKWRLSSFVIT